MVALRLKHLSHKCYCDVWLSCDGNTVEIGRNTVVSYNKASLRFVLLLTRYFSTTQ